MADEIRTVASVSISADEQSAAEAGKRDGAAYAEGLRSQIDKAAANITPQSGVHAQQSLISALPQRDELNGASALNVAQSRLARSYIDLAVQNGEIDAKQGAQITKLLRAYETVETNQLKVAAESDKQARAIAAQTEKITQAQSIFSRNNTSEEAVRQLEATRQANSRYQSTLSEQRRVELNAPGTSSARRFALDLGGNSLLQSEQGSFEGSPLANELKKGFLGTRQPGDSGSFGASIGQVGRFTALYGGAYAALFKVTQEFGNAGREALAFQDAIEQLNLATGKSTEENAQLADSLGSVAVAAGQAPSAGVKAGAQAIGLYDVAGASNQTQSNTVLQSVAVSSRIATLGGASVESVQQDLASLTRSFGLTVDQLSGVEDSLASISKATGRPVSEILPAVSAIGTIGANAGFTPNELAAAVARVASTTGAGVSGGAASLRQVFSRAGDVNFQGKLQAQFGISSEGKTLKDIFAEFAASNPDTTRVNQFSLLFGRGASQQASQILATQFPKIESLASGADAAAGTGLGKSQFGLVMQGFGEQLKLFGAQILETGKDLANTGILDFLALFVKGSLVAVQALDQVIKLFNEIPRPVRDLAFGFVELRLAMAALAGVQGLLKGVTAASVGGKIAGAIPFVGGDIAANLAARSAASELGRHAGSAALLDDLASAAAIGSGRHAATGAHAGLSSLEDFAFISSGGSHAASAEAAQLSRFATARAGVQGLGTRLLGGIGALPGVAQLGGAFGAETAVGAGAVAGGIGAAAVVAVGVIKNLVEIGAVKDQIQASAEQIALASTSEQAQAGLESAREAQRRAGGLTKVGFNLQTLTGQTALNDLNITGARDAQAQAAANVANAEGYKAQLDAAQKQAVSQNASNGIGSFDDLANLTEQIKGLGAVGYTAAQQVQAVSQAFGRLVLAGQGLATGTKAIVAQGGQSLFGLSIGNSATHAIQQGIQAAQENRDSLGGSLVGVGAAANLDKGATRGTYDKAIGQLQGVDEAQLRSTISGGIQSLLKGRGKDASKGDVQLDAGDVKAITDYVGGVVDKQLGGLPPSVKAAVKTALVEGARAQVSKVGATATPLTSIDIGNFLSSQLGQYGALATSYGATTGTKAGGEKQALGDIDHFIAQAKDGLKSITDPTELATATRLITLYEGQRQAFYNAYAVDAGAEASLLNSVANARLKPDDKVAQDANDVKTAAGNLALAQTGTDKDAIASATKALLDAQTKQAADLLASANANNLVGVDPRNQKALLAKQLQNAQRTLATQTPGSTDYANTQISIAALQRQQADLAVNTLNAQEQAGVAGNSSALAQATVSIDVARRNLNNTLKGTPEYYNALGALKTAQQQLGAAELAYASDLRKLNTDLTDPVAQARNAVADATAKLAADRKSGQGKDVIAADQVSLKNAQNQQEAAAFSQRLSDAQINDQLGRTSHEAYIKYLDSEHDRLTNIAHRTRQQQDELNQIDQALKAANQQLSGQFNLGDIKVPTPYEVRRYIAETAGRATSGAAAGALGGVLGGPGASAVPVTNYITIDGADTAAVEKILRQILGTSAVASATTTGRKT